MCRLRKGGVQGEVGCDSGDEAGAVFPSTASPLPLPNPTSPTPVVCLSSQGQIKSLCNKHSRSIKSSPLRPRRNSCRDSTLSVLLSCCWEGRGSSPAGGLHPRHTQAHIRHWHWTAKIAQTKIPSKCLHERRCPRFIVPLSVQHNKAQLQKKIA